MAKSKKYFEDRVAKEFGRDGKGFNTIFKKVEIRDQNGNLIDGGKIHDGKDLGTFLHNHQNNIDSYEYHIETRSDQYGRMVNGWERLRGVIKSASGRSTNPDIQLTGTTAEQYGSAFRYQAGKESTDVNKAAQTKIIRDINNKKNEILTHASTDARRIVETAKQYDPHRYYKLLSDPQNDLSFDDDKQVSEKAQLIISEAKRKDLKNTKTSSKDKWLSSVIWNLSKDTPYFKRAEKDYGSKYVRDIDDKLGPKSKYSQTAADKIKQRMQAKAMKSRFEKASSTYKFINRFKNQNPHLHSIDETIRFLNTEEGQRLANKQLWDEARRGKDGPIKSNQTAQNIQNKLGLSGPKIETTVADKPKAALDKTTQAKVAGNVVLGYSGSTYNKAGAFLRHVMKKDPEALQALRDGDKEAIRTHAPTSVDYDEMRQFYGGKQPDKGHIAKMVESGIDVNGLPSDLQEYVKKKTSGSSSSISKSSLFGRSKSSSSTRSSSSSSGRKPSTSDGGDLIGGKTIKWIGGKAVVVNERGKIGQAMHNTKTRIPGIRSSSEALKRKREKQREKQRAKEEEYKEIKDDKTLQYMTDEEKQYLAKDANWYERLRMKSKAKRAYRDPVYRAKVEAKTEQKKGIYEAKVLKAKKDSKRRARAATSNWWRAWYALTNNLWILIGVLLTISIVFLPVGLFYVLGWAMAVGITGLVQFVIWVFIELWFMIAQALVALIGMVGQGIMVAINFAGRAVTEALGFEYNAMEWTFVQDMTIPDLPGFFGSGHTWGEVNLVPPSFLRLDSFMPTVFDTDTILAKFIPLLSNFFNWVYAPVAERYTNWIASAEWWYVGLVIGVPAVLAIIGIVAAVFFVRRRLY